MTAALEARGVSKRYRNAIVVDHVDLIALPGRITVIIGPNGAGKTTLFNCLSGVDPPDSGTVWHRGEEVTGWSSDKLARRGLARTFQRSSVFPTLSVADNLRVAAESRGHRAVMRGLAGLPDTGARRADAVVKAVLTDLGLTGLAEVRAAVLPSGTLRLVELGRALCGRPDTVLLDEPASGLDSQETDELHRLLRRLAARELAVLMVEHDLGLVHDAADVVYVMDSGRAVACGPPSEVLGSVDIRSLLSGPSR